jgi:3-methyladenine DNA glycosylase AlkD
MDIIYNIRKYLVDNANKSFRDSSQYFFKDGVKAYGFKSKEVNDISKIYFQEVKKLSKDEIFKLCEELWKSGYMEECFIACNWCYTLYKKYKENDIEIFEEWIKNYVSNWATCDTFCNHSVGSFLEMYPNCIDKLKIWAKSDNRWLCRASAVSLIIPAKKGLFLNDIFEIADIMLKSDDDMIQKGYGWMLKCASKLHLQEVYDFVVERKGVMPRTAYRYAIENMPDDMKKEAMKK